MAQGLGRMAVGVFSFVMGAASAQAQSVESFYKGRTIEMLVGSEVGSGYDAYARLVMKPWLGVRDERSMTLDASFWAVTVTVMV